MEGLKPGWHVEGDYNEACASEGHCPYYFGRDKEGGCRYFMVFRIKKGTANNIDVSGITVIYVGDLPHSTFAEVLEKGSEGGIYVSDNATPPQREVLDILAVRSLGGGSMMQRVLGLRYVKMDVDEEDGTIHFRMPYGEMKMQVTRSHDGNPVRLENQTMPFLANVRTAHAPFWHWSDYDRHFDYRNRCGTWAKFAMTSAAQ